MALNSFLLSENGVGLTEIAAMSSQNTILILSSPTASGKSQTALHVADDLPVEIISADSRQIFKHMNIGTAKPGKKELDAIPHHFVDTLEPDKVWNAGKFAGEARQLIDKIFARGRIPFIVGGTGLYIKAMVDGIIDMPEVDLELRQRISARFEKEGLKKLVEELRRVDPSGSETIDLKNPRRVMRALEIYYMTGMTHAELEQKSHDPLPHRILWFGLNWDRGVLYNRIERRVDRMIEDGLIDEVRAILDMGYSKHTQALQSVGYAETIDYIERKINREEMIDRIKQNTRRFAKRQITWFGREKRIRWITVQADDDLKKGASKIIGQYPQTY